MIRICFIIGTLEIGGAEKQLLKLLKNIDRKRFLPVLIALRGGRLKEDFENTVKLSIIGKRWKVDPWFFVKLIFAIRKAKPDIVHTFMFTSNTWARIAGIVSGVRVFIASERCVDIWKKRHHLMIDRALLLFTARIAANSEAVKDFYRKTGKIPGRKITVIYNGVDLNEFTGDRISSGIKKELGIEKTGFLIGAGGRFTEQKGFINLLKAVPPVIKFFPDTKFILVGDGPLRKSFEDFVKTKKLSGHVFFTGYRKDILNIFAACDIIAAPSLFEGMPNTVLEAMALKKPVIGTGIPEIAELIEDKNNGFLVPVKNNSGKIAEKIIFLLQNPLICKSMGEKSYNLVQKKFSLPLMVKNYEKLYLEVLREKRRIKTCARYAE